MNKSDSLEKSMSSKSAFRPSTPSTAVEVLDEEKKVDLHTNSILQTSPTGHVEYMPAKQVAATKPSPMNSPIMGANGEFLISSGDSSAAKSTKSKVSFTGASAGVDPSSKAPSSHHLKPKVGVPTDFQANDGGQELTSRVYTSENLKPIKRRWK
jgi:hypothetical protein